MPCHGKKRPLYSTNVDPAAGPVAAAQKALAKMYGCYEHLSGGRVGAALEDLTGGICDKLYLRDGVAAADGSPKQPHIHIADELSSGALWERLDAIQEAGHLIAATYKPRYAALAQGTDSQALVVSDAAVKAVGGSAKPGASEPKKPNLVYPIVDLRRVEAHGFVKLRDPWAKVGDGAAPEWKGDWSSSSQTWQDQPSVAAALGGKPRDGSFWMSFDDFFRAFNKVVICYLPRAPRSTFLTAEGEWTRESSGGRLSTAPGAKWRDNPQYKLTVSQRCSVLIALMQQDSQTDANDSSDAYPHAIGFHLLGAPERGARRALSAADGALNSRYANSRQVGRACTCQLPPATCTCQLPPATCTCHLPPAHATCHLPMHMPPAHAHAHATCTCTCHLPMRRCAGCSSSSRRAKARPTR